ncbi:renin receptor-like [Saccostrea echinata]|uniref:renin receptor-like n=1 Tax=Saccostrea echinata TaxID=191078 RepID=UPI002A82473E|nr:renin receptor-like [Saccostrea echinata]
MADREKGLLVFQFYILIFIGVCCGQELVVTHAPSYVTFQEQKEPLSTSNVPNVITHTLGVQTDGDVNWNGLAQNSFFKRPKANVLVSILGHNDLKNKPLTVKNMARFPVKTDIPMVDIASLMNTLQGVFFDQSPLLLDAGMDNNFFDVHSDFDVFRKLPDTLRKMSDRLLDSDSVLQRHSVGSLNSSKPSDLKLMGELQLIQDVINTVSDHPEMLKSKTPDLFSFTITGLHDIVTKHGRKCPQTEDAHRLISDFITKMTEDFKKLYKDNVVVEVLAINPEKKYIRKTRSLMAVDDSEVNINLSKDYDENYPAIFNIILWMMIAMFVVIFAVSYGMWNIDPGRDSIIYRMTTTRLKKD